MKQAFVDGTIRFILVVVWFFAPVIPFVLAVAFMSIVDSFYGIKKAKKLHKEDPDNHPPATSRGFRKGYVPKVLGYSGVVLVTYFIDYFLLNEFTKNLVATPHVSTKIIVLFLIVNEVISIDENWKAIKGYSFIKKFSDTIMRVKKIKKEINE